MEEFDLAAGGYVAHRPGVSAETPRAPQNVGLISP